jgi:hypothetical protein
MSTAQNDSKPATPAFVPWYKTAVFRGILVTFFTQAIARVASQYHIDITALSALGINPDWLAQVTLDGISTLALAYAAHGRAKKPLPAVTLTKKQADEANAAAAQSFDSGGGNTAAPLSQPPENKP